MAVCADGDVWSWGAADCGLLGTDDVDSLASEEALRTSILVGPIYFSAAPLQLPGVHDAVQVALANKHALVLCALDRDEATGAAGLPQHGAGEKGGEEAGRRAGKLAGKRAGRGGEARESGGKG
eukprot:5347808-Pleurochrysis_carterae.AAC.1